MLSLTLARQRAWRHSRCRAIGLLRTRALGERPQRLQDVQCLFGERQMRPLSYSSSLKWFNLFQRHKKRARWRKLVTGSLTFAGGAMLILYVLGDDILHPDSAENTKISTQKSCRKVTRRCDDAELSDVSAWGKFTHRFNTFASSAQQSTNTSIVDYVVPDWVWPLAGYVQKLQKELNMAPDSLAVEIRREAQDPYLNPEILYPATVRVSDELCAEEKRFLAQRKKNVVAAFAQYLDLPEKDINPDDVPCIAMVGSGGGLRALVAGTGFMLATKEAGLFDCVTYTAGVSGSCWLQALYHSSISGQSLDKMVDHMKARLGVHIAYPPVALSALISAPTNKFLLRGFVEKLQGDPDANYGLVDVYGILLAARLLVPKGELGVDDRDLKLSHQRENLRNGEHPLPIYTAVRHEIPIQETASTFEKATDTPSEETKEKAKQEAWFQWFEITPYEFFCEEFSAGIPTWALGRRFKDGKDETVSEVRVPEIRLSLLLGIFGSAFCATLSHYYKEVRPVIQGLAGFGSVDDIIEGRNQDLSKVHPIDPSQIPNFAYGMQGKLPATTPQSIYENTHIQLMDAGMSNNLPIYPLLRPGRNVDILIAFDASADVKQDNWLSVADGYARQRGIKGWPLGLGWPKETDTTEKAVSDLQKAQAETAEDAESKLDKAKADEANKLPKPSKSQELSYCNVWVGTTEERAHDERQEDMPPSKTVEEDWELMEPNAGITVMYFPQLVNPKVEGIDPKTSDFMSTWNFVYTPEQIDKVVELSRTNFGEGKERTKRVVRAVYERKKKLREEKEKSRQHEKWRRRVRRGLVNKMGEGDHFS